jgi:chromosome segregation ATPase
MSRITHSELELSQLKEERKSLLQKLKNVDSSSYSEKIQKLSAAIEKARNDCRQAKEILVENQNQLQEYRDTAIE